MPKKLKHKLNWPALSTVDFNVVPDSTFNIGSGITTITPNLVSLLWGMPPDSYEANRILYPEKTVVNPYIGLNTIIYNPKTNNRDAVALDALHVMHDSPLYLELYQQYVQSLPKGFEPLMDAANDEFGERGMTIIDKYQKGLPLSQEELEAIEPIYDALLRRQFAPDYMRNVPHGYQDKATLPVIESIGMSGDEAIRRYMESYPLKEITVTASKKADGGELNTPLEWDQLSMKEKAAYIRMSVASGYKDIDSIKGVYNQFKKGGPTRKQVFLNTLELSLTNNSRYNTPGWRKYLTDLANMESGYQAGITNSIGAKGYFQLMPDNRAASWSTPTLQFDEMYRMTDANMKYLRKHMTEKDLRRANDLGIDIYGLMAGAHLGGVEGALNALRGTRNAKDKNGTSVMSYMTRFSQTTPRVTGIEGGMIPIIDNTYLASPENVTIDNTTVIDPNATLEEIRGNIPQAITIDEEEPVGTVNLDEVVVTGHRKPNLVAMLDFIDTVSNSTTPMQPIYQLQEPTSTKNVMQLVNNDRVTLLQKDLEDRLLADERRRRLGYDYRDNVAKDIDDIRFYRNMAAEGGYLFPTGGPLITVNPGDRVFTDECALWSNSTLRDNGYLINGTAWNLGNVDMLYNGFDGLTRPETYDSKAVMDYNHQATLNVFKNFDSKTLDTKKPYVVNMFYNNSPSLETAYNEGDGVTGTHTGLLTYDPDTKKWWVTHNIHGNIHLEPFIDLQKNTGKYGVTAIYAPRPKTVWNRVKGFFGFEDGGPLNLFEDGGNTLYLTATRAGMVTPEYTEGTNAGTNYHQNWMENRLEQMQENIDSEGYDTTAEAETARQMNNIYARTERFSNPNNPDDVHMYDEYGNSIVIGQSRSGRDAEGNVIPTEIVYSDSYREGGVPADVLVHERTHAMSEDPWKYTPLEAKVNAILQERYGDNVHPAGSYFLRPSEVYAGLMLQRYQLGLSPTYVVTPEDIVKWREVGLLNNYLNTKDDAILLRLFNDVAYEPIQHNYNTNMAALGGPIVRAASALFH